MDVTQEERNWGIGIQLSWILSFWLPGFGFVFPLVFWLVKRGDSRFLDAQGCEAVNFHLSLFLYGLGLSLCIVLFSIVTLGMGILIILPFLIVVPIIGFLIALVCSIRAAIVANEGDIYAYPLSMRLITPAY